MDVNNYTLCIQLNDIIQILINDTPIMVLFKVQ